MREHRYYVCIMISSSRRALYIGVTNNLERRVFQHKNDEFEGFSQQYQAHRLVWFERYSNIQTAIAREKQLKGWRRAKKDWLVQLTNPGWRDLSAEWGKPIELLTTK
ncbi:MAG TPA: GIY-YIG nuclease family protein [Terriglobales bacterium]|nr:GIY-YIG nuclease family protein [Terriglobales bacterium]